LSKRLLKEDKTFLLHQLILLCLYFLDFLYLYYFCTIQ